MKHNNKEWNMTFEDLEVRRIAELFKQEALIKSDLRWESFSDVFIKEVQKASLVIDCGAEYGYYIDMALKYGDSTIEIIAIEPEKTRFDALHKFFAKHKNVCILPYALSQTNGFITLYKTEGKSASVDENLTQWEYTEKSSFQVESRTLDSLLEGKSPDIIKMDIEGAEVFAFQGMYEMLKHSSPVVFLEYHMKFVHSLEPEGEKIILNILQSLGYKIYDYRGNVTTLKHARVIIAKPERAQSIDFIKEGNQRNYHFAKQFSMLYFQFMEYASQYSKIVIYGAGTMGQTAYKLLDSKKLVAMVDQNAKAIYQSYCDVQDLTFFEITDPKQYDAILITVLGREDHIVQDLMQKYNIDAAKFLIFNLDQ